MTLRVSEEAARQVLQKAERDPALSFNSYFPFYCRICDSAVPPVVQAGHLEVHRGELERLSRERKAEAARRLREAAALKRERV